MRAVHAALAGALVPLVACAAAIDWGALRGSGSSDASTSDVADGGGGSSGGGDAREDGADGTSPSSDGGSEGGSDSGSKDASTGGTDSGASDGAAEAEAAPPLTYEQVVLADSPIAYFRFEDNPGSAIAVDSVSGGPSGAVSGSGVTFQSKGLLGSEPSSYSAYFDASQGGNVKVGGSNDTQLQFHGNVPFSIELWMLAEYTDAAPNYTRIVSDEVDPAGPSWSGYYLDTPPTGQQGILFTTEENDTACGASYTSALPAGPVHVVVTYDGATFILYVNGAGNDNTACAPGMTQTNTAFTIGGSSFGGPFYWGYLDEVAVYGTALPAARVKAHYDAGK